MQMLLPEHGHSPPLSYPRAFLLLRDFRDFFGLGVDLPTKEDGRSAEYEPDVPL
ncbi:hypothetical protein LQ953_13260 [Sphingomonas sp. IC-56]|uniref:hypothetical protein n=1 Tax=Sphingomonas sp. IC-56 TaxID=2898529 RepID=UPI001E3FE6B5|nr:hypothetical protein [Sphingomonas sp. IC-56]MCD2324986.1 hypothetical protein [Sphingomonas sp. IC-56]